MSDRHQASIAQPGMTARGRAGERVIEAYVRQTTPRVPLAFTDRVMAVIEAESPTRRSRWIPMSSPLRPGRLRVAGLVAVLVAMMGGAALVAGASGIIGPDVGGPAYPDPDRLPIFVTDPTATPRVEIEGPTTQPMVAPGTPHPTEPIGRDPVEPIDQPDSDERTEDPKATHEVGETDEPEATDTRDEGGDHADEPEGTDEPENDGSSGRSEDGRETPDDSSGS